MSSIALRQLPGTARADILAFFAAFLVGTIIYLILKVADAAQVVITTALVTIMVLYAGSVTIVSKLRVRLDQAGDNAYYLGLLFTLLSMAFALYEFSGAQTEAQAAGASAKQIIGNFGIALGTTITGIFLRVILHQMRIDPADVERMTRLELSEASSRVKSTLESLSIDTARLLDEMRQRATDQVQRSIEEGASALAELTSRAANAVAELAEKAAAAQVEAIAHTADVAQKMVELGGEIDATVQRLQNLAPPPANLAATLENIANAFQDVAKQAEMASQPLREAAEQTGRVAAQLSAVSINLSTENEAAIQRVQSLVESVESGIGELKRSLHETADVLNQDRELLRLVTEECVSAVRLMQDSEKAAAKVLVTLTELVQGLTAVLDHNPRAEADASR